MTWKYYPFYNKEMYRHFFKKLTLIFYRYHKWKLKEIPYTKDHRDRKVRRRPKYCGTLSRDNLSIQRLGSLCCRRITWLLLEGKQWTCHCSDRLVLKFEFTNEDKKKDALYHYKKGVSVHCFPYLLICVCNEILKLWGLFDIYTLTYFTYNYTMVEL